MVADYLVAADAAATMDAATTAVSGSSYCFSSAAMASDSAAADVTAAVVHGATTAVDAVTTVAANSFGNGLGGIFGCPSCHGSNPAFVETLKLFLPYFPLHIQRLISMYLNLIEFMHTFEMIQNMMNHMDEYQALFQMFENMVPKEKASTTKSPFPVPGGFSMPDFGSIQKMMEGSDLVDEFTYVEEPPRSGRDGS